MFMKSFLLLIFAFSFTIFAQENLEDKIYEANAKELAMGKTISMPKPPYPSLAKQARIAGRVNVKIIINLRGEVISAVAISGNPLLHQVAEDAAMQARFTVSTVNGKPVKVIGTIVYNFAMETSWESIGYTLATIKRGRTGYGFVRKTFNIGLQGFEAEKEEILSLTENESIEGKPEQAIKLIDKIKTKLAKSSPIDEWYFNLGVISSNLGHFANVTNGESEFVNSFRDLRKLINFPPTGILEERLSYLRAIVKDVKESD
ncbi:MAG: energy transducer TonB, partial [Blastocatellia bacterium]|nr:energy transducer TonB [Blastocatellia bacterium]